MWTLPTRWLPIRKHIPEKEIIRLGIGDVTQPLAKCVVQAMRDAAAEMGHQGEASTATARSRGYPFLKQAIQGYYAGRGTQLARTRSFISDGAKSDLANVLGLFDVDNTVLVPDPVYPTYVDDNVTDGRKIIYSRTRQENGFLGMPDESVKADIIYICSPNNPTGAAYTRDQLKAWVDYARKNDAIILYDAAYECFISDGELARSIFEIEGARECAIENLLLLQDRRLYRHPLRLHRRAQGTGARGHEHQQAVAAPPDHQVQRRALCGAARRCRRVHRERHGRDPVQSGLLPPERQRSSPTHWTSAACGTAAARTAPTSGCAAPAT